MLSVVIPVHNAFEIAHECISNLKEYAHGPIEIIVVDNASATPFLDDVKIIRNEKNVGFWPALLQGIRAASNNIVLTLHSDVLVWTRGYDTWILEEFNKDEKLGIAGFFGGRGIAPNGGRGHPEGNMIARKYGTPQHLHGNILNTTHPAVVFDSLSLIFDRSKLETISPDTIPPHHWTDRLVSLRMLAHNYHALTIGVMFDHGSGFSSTTSGMQTFTEDWCRANNIAAVSDEMVQKHNMPKWELTLYLYGLQKFETELAQLIGPNNQLWVRQDHTRVILKQG